MPVIEGDEGPVFYIILFEILLYVSLLDYFILYFLGNFILYFLSNFIFYKFLYGHLIYARALIIVSDERELQLS